jgi:predicted nucleic acid-binding protein
MVDPAVGLILLDACCLLNLYATRCREEILTVVEGRFAVVERVAAEALYTRRGGSGEDADEKDAVDMGQLIARGLLEVLTVETAEEAASYVGFAAELDDGEAMTCALALHRGAAVATDDRKALRLLASRAPQIRVRSTTQLIKEWAEGAHVLPGELRNVLIDVRQRARFAPGRHDPLHAWWDAAMQVT